MKKNSVGEKISTLCTDKNISLSELAERSGMTEEQLQLLLNADQIPSLSPLMKIARALGVRIGTFLDDSSELGPVICKEQEVKESASFSSQITANSHLDFFSLAASKAGRHMEPFFINIKPAEKYEPLLSSHEGEEFIYVLQGSVKIAYGKETHILHAGDSIYYDSVVDHFVSALNGEPAQIVAVVYAPF